MLTDCGLVLVFHRSMPCTLYNGAIEADNTRVCCSFLTDIDDCSVNNRCEKTTTCVNTPGSYTCGCDPGSQLDNDNRTCACKYTLNSV